MFTGLIERTAEVIWMVRRTEGIQLVLADPGFRQTPNIGESLAINGCCLTVAAHRQGQLVFTVLDETLARTNLGSLRAKSQVNVERALAATGRLGGHFVQGHIDCTAKVISLVQHGADYRLEIGLPPEFSHLVCYKGSIAVNGVSLTVAEVLERSMVCWIIPHTFDVTNIHGLVEGDLVNLEFDILAKYVDRIIGQRSEVS